MNAKKCDRCGVFYEKRGYIPKYELYLHNSFGNDWPRDLCDDCGKELDKFMGKLPEDIKEVKKKKKK